MPVITCKLTEDGKLIPSMVEFEPGELIEFKSEQPVRLEGGRRPDIELNRAFNLDEFSAHLQDGVIEISLSLGKRPAWSAKDHRGPPPPPPHVVIKIGSGKSAENGGPQAGAAGTGG